MHNCKSIPHNDRHVVSKTICFKGNVVEHEADWYNTGTGRGSQEAEGSW